MDKRQQRCAIQVRCCSGGNEFDAFGKSKLGQTKVKQANSQAWNVDPMSRVYAGRIAPSNVLEIGLAVSFIKKLSSQYVCCTTSQVGFGIPAITTQPQNLPSQ